MYALAKYKAETRLLQLAENSDMEIVIVRPPIIYGINVKGYFGTLLQVIKKVPLPFGSLFKNKRSLIYIENFLDFISTIFEHPNAANDIFLCSDQYDLSTAELINILSLGMYKKTRNFSIPRPILRTSFYLLGKYYLYEKLSSSLRIDSSKATKNLKWVPPFKSTFAINKVAQEYWDD